MVCIILGAKLKERQLHPTRPLTGPQPEEKHPNKYFPLFIRDDSIRKGRYGFFPIFLWKVNKKIVERTNEIHLISYGPIFCSILSIKGKLPLLKG
jgi:hypothetical protein